MPVERKSVPAGEIHNLCSEFAEKIHEITSKILQEKKDIDEYSARVVAVFGALLLVLNKFISFMVENGYTTDELEKLETDIIESFSIEKPDPTDLKN